MVSIKFTPSSLRCHWFAFINVSDWKGIRAWVLGMTWSNCGKIGCTTTTASSSSSTVLVAPMAAFILPKVDYSNVVLAGLPKRDLDWLQSIINAAARLTTGARRYDHVMLLLKDLCWLHVPERITHVRSRLQLSVQFSATLATRSHSACRWSHFTTSTVVVIFICPAGAGNMMYHSWWPSVCRRWASCLEHPTRLHHRLLVIVHFQDLSIQSGILST